MMTLSLPRTHRMSADEPTCAAPRGRVTPRARGACGLCAVRRWRGLLLLLVVVVVVLVVVEHTAAGAVGER